MFDIDTGDNGGGAQGPFLSWFSAGSMAKQVYPKTWALRVKEDDSPEVTYEKVAAFETGVVFDLDTLRLGYVADDGGPGRAPSKQWAPTPNLRTFPNPEPTRKRATGGDYWSKILSIRVALNKSQAATWEQSGFGPFDAFARLAGHIKSQWQEHSQNGKLLPLVRQTGIDTLPSKKGNPSHVPVLEIVKWVPRPACLTADAPAIDMAEPAPAPQPAPKPAPQPVAADLSDFG